MEKRARQHYLYFLPLATRWMDNDAYGHVNNVIYYSWFDTVVNQYLIEQNVLQVLHSSVIGLVVETQCNYFSPISFPEHVDVGLSVVHLGNSSVRYEIGIFAKDSEVAAAQGHFVHVYVDRESRKTAAIPATIRAVLQSLHYKPEIKSVEETKTIR